MLFGSYEILFTSFKAFIFPLNTHQWSLSCGDSWTSDMLWRLQTVSMLGRMQVLIIRASICTATRSVVQTENAINIPIGTFVSLSSCTSTIATCESGGNFEFNNRTPALVYHSTVAFEGKHLNHRGVYKQSGLTISSNKSTRSDCKAITILPVQHKICFEWSWNERELDHEITVNAALLTF